MKTRIFFATTLLFTAICAHAQWTTGGTHIYNSNAGNVGIGISTPIRKLHISGTGEVVEKIESTTDGYASLEFTSNGKSWQWSKRPGSYADAMQLYFHNGTVWSDPYVSFLTNGNVGIGTGTPDAKLAVKGGIHAQEIRIDLSVPGPDYVFESDYKLSSLAEIKAYIEKNKHLPEVPSAKDMETNGVNLGEMNMLLLKKIEELTLHIIRQDERIEKLEKNKE